MSEPRALPIETLRPHPANERTLLGWLRTGIALMAFGFAIAHSGHFLSQLAVAGPRRRVPRPFDPRPYAERLRKR